MKSTSIILILIFFANSTIAIGQPKTPFQYSFLRQNYLPYKNTYVKLNPATKQTQLYYAIFLNLESSIDPGEMPAIAYKVEGKVGYTNVDSMSDKVFRIDSFAVPDDVFVIFKLIDIKSKEILYFRYFPDIENKWVFLSSGLNECSYIRSEKDEFTGEITFTSSMKDNSVYLSKHIASGKTTYYLNLSFLTRDLELAATGVWVLFKDGSKMARTSQSVHFKVVNAGNYLCYSSLPLSIADLTILRTKSIDGVRLSAFDFFINPDVAKTIQKDAKCIVVN